MDLEFTIRISARHIPLETYKKIRKVISWQLKNELDSPFFEPEFRYSLDGDLAPSFTHRNFDSHSSELSNTTEFQCFTELANELINEFDFSHQEIRILDSALSYASIEFNKLIGMMDAQRTAFHVDSTRASIILDHTAELPDINGAPTFWGRSTFG